MTLGRIFNWWLDQLERFGNAALAGIVDAQPPVWPECELDPDCHQEATCKVGRSGDGDRRLYACFKHGREYLGADTFSGEEVA